MSVDDAAALAARPLELELDLKFFTSIESLRSFGGIRVNDARRMRTIFKHNNYSPVWKMLTQNRPDRFFDARRPEVFPYHFHLVVMTTPIIIDQEDVRMVFEDPP